jgi:hypothetical protein
MVSLTRDVADGTADQRRHLGDVGGHVGVVGLDAMRTDQHVVAAKTASLRAARTAPRPANSALRFAAVAASLARRSRSRRSGDLIERYAHGIASVLEERKLGSQAGLEAAAEGAHQRHVQGEGAGLEVGDRAAGWRSSCPRRSARRDRSTGRRDSAAARCRWALRGGLVGVAAFRQPLVQGAAADSGVGDVVQRLRHQGSVVADARPRRTRLAAPR